MANRKSAHARRAVRLLPRGTCVLEGCGNTAIIGRFCRPCQQWWGRVRHMTHNHFLEYMARCGRITVRKEFLWLTNVPKPKEATALKAASHAVNQQYSEVY